jgi:hypothetical protein
LIPDDFRDRRRTRIWEVTDREQGVFAEGLGLGLVAKFVIISS